MKLKSTSLPHLQALCKDMTARGTEPVVSVQLAREVRVRVGW